MHVISFPMSCVVVSFPVSCPCVCDDFVWFLGHRAHRTDVTHAYHVMFVSPYCFNRCYARKCDFKDTVLTDAVYCKLN